MAVIVERFMLSGIYVVMTLLSTLFTFIKYQVLILPNTIFTILWSFVGLLSMFNSLDLIEPSATIHLYIISSIVIFNILYLSFSPGSKKRIFRYLKKDSIFEIDYPLIYIAAAVSIGFLSIHTINTIAEIRQYGLDMTGIRVMNYGAVENSDIMFFAFFTRSVPLAVTTAVSLIGSINLNMGNKKLVLLSIFMVVLYTFTYGGRYQLLNFISFYIGSYLILKRKSKIKLKKSYVVLLVGALVFMTVLRGASIGDLFRKITSYFVGSLSFLELILRNPQLFGLADGSYTFGYLTFGFFFEPIVLAIKLFLGSGIKVPSYYFNIYAQPFYNIGEGTAIYYNNNTTMFYNFIYDFGSAGVIIGTGFVALMICLLEKRYIKANNLRSLFLLVFSYSVIINSTMMYTLTNVNASLILLFLAVFVRKRQVKRHKTVAQMSKEKGAL
ncbi:MAG: oligosaccharide repeat unit polymerase [Clostridiales bacterium]|nr:oligosaccharide repeat unit polymerase [Clostridiales bacterium]